MTFAFHDFPRQEKELDRLSTALEGDPPCPGHDHDHHHDHHDELVGEGGGGEYSNKKYIDLDHTWAPTFFLDQGGKNASKIVVPPKKGLGEGILFVLLGEGKKPTLL